MKLYLIRHTSVNVAKGVCYGKSNVDVNNSFPQEALAVKRQLDKLKSNYAFTSPLTRCVKLANFCGYPMAIQDERLQEMDFGLWEMQLWDHIDDPDLDEWLKDWVCYPAGQGESFSDLYRRFVDFVESFTFDDGAITLFTHGGIINCARIYAGLANINRVFNDTPACGSITEINVSIPR